ncbi:glycosyltransferase family 2 protein [Mariniflexile sp.]|uniref:glycosyltransferase family 2 protein n=1 Tax=Mariniflexile sp. TaxID=1979402 RepID=UPI003567C246
MSRIPQSPPKISPITDGLHRPLWSVMIPTYNCSNYLIETIQSVLQQDLGEKVMQIEVVDDYSTDTNVEELVNTIGKGRVSYYRQKENVGSLRNFETCINRARGTYIHLLHGDDRVKNGYYTAITNLFEKFPTAGAAFSSWDYIKSDGILSRQSVLEANNPCVLDNWLLKLAEHQRIQYAAITVKREVYEKLGSFYIGHYGEDWEMWARIAKVYDMAYIPEYLAQYREHKNSITWQSYISGQNIKDIGKVIETIISYLPKKDQNKKLKMAKKKFVYWMLDEILVYWFSNQNKQMIHNQISSIWKLHKDSQVMLKIIVIILYVYTEPYRKVLKPFNFHV